MTEEIGEKYTSNYCVLYSLQGILGNGLVSRFRAFEKDVNDTVGVYWKLFEDDQRGVGFGRWKMNIFNRHYIHSQWISDMVAQSGIWWIADMIQIRSFGSFIIPCPEKRLKESCRNI